MYDDKKDEKSNKLVYFLFLIIIVLIGILSYFIFLNKDKRECNKCSDMVIEEQYQTINYSNFNFKMPIDWKFVDDSDEYGITNSDNSIFISFEVIDEPYDVFISDDYQITYIETIQTNNNIKINQLKKYENYYLYEGTLNDYDYLIIGKGNDKKTILIKTTFIDKVSYSKHKDKVIAFSLSN